MKKSQLKKLIKEEISKALNENESPQLTDQEKNYLKRDIGCF